MRGYMCHVCNGICDPGELENGVCFDCRVQAMERREKRNLEIRKEIGQLMQARYREQADGQLTMELL